jgi:hypothetical protein
MRNQRTTPSRASLSKKQEAEPGIETSDDIHFEFGAFIHPFNRGGFGPDRLSREIE